MSTALLLACASIATLVGVLVPVILDGVERKLKAIVQSRIGPPIVQTLYDLLKLASKEYKSVHTKPFIILYFSSFIVCAIVSMFLTLMYTMAQNTLLLVLAISFFAISLTTLTIVPLLVPNPFSYIGGMREVILAIVNESSFIVSAVLYIIAVRATNQWTAPSVLHFIALVPAVVAMVLSGYAMTGRAPFDIAEAEPELASGVLIEFSGFFLALYIYSNLLKKFITKLLIAVLIASSVMAGAIETLVVAYTIAIILWVSFALTSSILGRSRVDLAPRTLTKVYIGLLAISITGLLAIGHV